jgi:plastocyanin
MARIGTAALLAAAIVAATAGSAFAAPATVTTTAANQFSAPSFDHDAGTVATLMHTGGASHSVVSVATAPGGQPLFSSALISSGSTPINGTASLPAGDYAFYCGFHGPSMSSSLHITGTAAPGSGAAPNGPYSSKKKKCKRKHGAKKRRCKKKHRRR